MDTPHTTEPSLSKHRIEALTDGIFAVAMTLLVIELRVPEHAHIGSQAELIAAVRGLLPLGMSWLLSFLVLAIFWISNHRLYSHLRHVDTPMLWLTILTLAGASLLPFASALNGQHASLFSQVIYSSNMILLSVAAICNMRYVHRHPELCALPIRLGVYRAAQFRAAGLIAIALVAIGLSGLLPGSGNMGFALMPVIVMLSAKIQRRYDAPAPA